MRRHDVDLAAGTHQAMEFLHGTDHIGYVFDYVYGVEHIEGGVAKRIKMTVEIGQNVRARSGVSVKADGSGMLVNPASDVKDSHRELYRVGQAILPAAALERRQPRLAAH